jgi:hypothetical protein
MAAMLNILGSHDVPRLLTVLGDQVPEEVALRRVQLAGACGSLPCPAYLVFITAMKLA